jgi:hypothetical protein
LVFGLAYAQAVRGLIDKEALDLFSPAYDTLGVMGLR